MTRKSRRITIARAQLALPERGAQRRVKTRAIYRYAAAARGAQRSRRLPPPEPASRPPFGQRAGFEGASASA